MTEHEHPDEGLHLYDVEQIIDDVTELIQARPEWHGFRTREEIAKRFRDGGVFWSHRHGEIACAVVFRHLEKRPHTRVYQTAMSEELWDVETWRRHVRRVLDDSPYNRVIAKTPFDVKEYDLWDDIAVKVDEESGKHRRLAVWLLAENDYDGLREW